MRSNKIFANLAGGEISPQMQGRSDIPLYPKSLALCQNYIIIPEGGFKFRSGSIFVKNTRLNKKAFLIPFQFNDSQSYLIEATDQKFRFYKDDSAITETAKNITGATTATPCVITSAAHGFNNDDEVYISGVGGMNRLNGRFYLVANKTANTFELTDINGTPINATNYGTYTSGGTVARVYEITTPYLEADLFQLQFAQNADTMYIVNQNYEPRVLTRSGHANWSLATFVRTADPFTGANDYPGSVCFTDTGRIIYGCTKNNPESVWFSQAPDTTTTKYDNFTTGTSATDAGIFTVSPILGKVNNVQWITNTNKTLVMGTYGELRRLYGGTEQEAITPLSFTAKSVNSFGAERILPVSNGSSLFYIQRGGMVVRSLEYDIQIDGYTTADRNLVTYNLSEPGIIQIIEQQARPDVIWSVRNDGKLLGLTFKDKEDISAWHRHQLGGSHVDSNNVTKAYGKVLSVGRMPRPNHLDELWMVVERKIGSVTTRSVEYFADYPIYPTATDFYSGNEDADDARFRNYQYEVQKTAVHLDMAVIFDGTAAGTAASATLTPGATAVGSGVTFTASASVFTASMVGRELRKKFDSNGGGGGRAIIRSFTSGTQVTCEIVTAFDSTSAIPAGNWYLTSQSISGLEHLEGQTVSVVSDGGVHDDCVVTNGGITLNQQSSYVICGFKYVGIIKLMNIDQGGQVGPALSLPRNVLRTAIQFLNTLGTKFGTTLYTLEKVNFTFVPAVVDRPTALFTGTQRNGYNDRWEADAKTLIIYQDAPSPCTVLAIGIEMETSDE